MGTIVDPTISQQSPLQPQPTPANGYKVILVDDDPDMQRLLRGFYSEHGYQIEVFADALQALSYLQQKSAKSLGIDLIISDLQLPQMNGMEFMQKLHQANIKIPIIMITAYASKEGAIEALNCGAFDYITKPINFTELGVLSQRAIRLHHLEKEFQDLKDKLSSSWRMDAILGKSAQMQQLFDLIERVASFPSNILITGESGTGKEMVARTIHEHSGRSKKPFIAVNCSAIPENLLESELFGHVKGAFTGAVESRHGLFEAANGGTVFLDEIGDMPLSLQTKLLRVLQERKIRPVGGNQMREIDVRIIAATHQNLKQAIQANEFREDLFYRLCVVPLELPPLRERKEDIPMLAEHFLKKYTSNSRSEISGFTKDAMAVLLERHWPGNVRELENTIERAVVLCRNKIIDVSDITVEINETSNNKLATLFPDLVPLNEMEKRYIEHVLIKTGNKKEQAAQILAVNRKTLYRKAKEYKINLPKKSEL